MTKKMALAFLSMALGITLVNAGCGCSKSNPNDKSCYEDQVHSAQTI